MAQRHLRRVDPVLAKVVPVVGPCTLAPRRDYFAALCQSVDELAAPTPALRWNTCATRCNGEPATLINVRPAPSRGFRSFSDFLRSRADLVELDESSTTPLVRLK